MAERRHRHGRPGRGWHRARHLHRRAVDSARRRGDRGSVLMLMPVAVLIVIMLGALAVDQAIVFGAQRDLVASAQAAANDAVAAGVDVGDLRADGQITVDRARIGQVVASAARREGLAVTARWQIVGGELVVHFERRVEVIFSQGVPGGRGTRPVTATAHAVIIRR